MRAKLADEKAQNKCNPLILCFGIYVVIDNNLRLNLLDLSASKSADNGIGGDLSAAMLTEFRIFHIFSP